MLVKRETSFFTGEKQGQERSKRDEKNTDFCRVSGVSVDSEFLYAKNASGSAYGNGHGDPTRNSDSNCGHRHARTHRHTDRYADRHVHTVAYPNTLSMAGGHDEFVSSRRFGREPMEEYLHWEPSSGDFDALAVVFAPPPFDHCSVQVWGNEGSQGIIEIKKVGLF